MWTYVFARRAPWFSTMKIWWYMWGQLDVIEIIVALELLWAAFATQKDVINVVGAAEVRWGVSDRMFMTWDRVIANTFSYDIVLRKSAS